MSLQLLIFTSIIAAAFTKIPPECVDDIAACCNIEKDDPTAHFMTECGELHKDEKDIMCALECYLNKTGIMANGKFDEKAATDLSMFSPEIQKKWEATYVPIAKKCIEEAESSQIKLKAGFDKCAPKSGYFMNCVGMHIAENCPADLWNASPECDALKSNLKNCKIIVPENIAAMIE